MDLIACAIPTCNIRLKHALPHPHIIICTFWAGCCTYHSGIRLKMSRRVDLTCFDGKSARRGMASCHITVISPSDTA